MIICLFIIVVIETAKGQRLCEADKDPVSEGDPVSPMWALNFRHTKKIKIYTELLYTLTFF